MNKSISVIQKKKRGRPATGSNPLIAIRLPKEEIKRLDHWASKIGETRTGAVRKAIKRAIDNE